MDNIIIHIKCQTIQMKRMSPVISGVSQDEFNEIFLNAGYTDNRQT